MDGQFREFIDSESWPIDASAQLAKQHDRLIELTTIKEVPKEVVLPVTAPTYDDRTRVMGRTGQGGNKEIKKKGLHCICGNGTANLRGICRECLNDPIRHADA